MIHDSQKIRSLLESDIGAIVKIVGLVVAVVMFIILPQKDMEKAIALQAKDISEINTNHLMHIQDSIKAIEDEITDIKTKNEASALVFAKYEVKLDEVLKLLKK